MRLLYIAPKFESNSFGGDYVCKRNLRFLKSILGEENVIEYHLKKSSLKRVIISSFSACSYGMRLYIPADEEIGWGFFRLS